jgi:hypothetical protein
MSGRDPVFGDPVRREDVEQYGRLVIQDNPGDAEVAGAILNVIGLSPQDVLRGSATIPGRDDAATLSAIRAVESAKAAGLTRFGPGGESPDEALRRLRSLTEPVTVALEGVKINPYTAPLFRNEAEFEAFRKDVAYPDLLRKLGVDPASEEDVATWEGAQLDNIVRTNP